MIFYLFFLLSTLTVKASADSAIFVFKMGFRPDEKKLRRGYCDHDERRDYEDSRQVCEERKHQ